MSKGIMQQTIMHLLNNGANAEFRSKRFYGAFTNNMRKIYTDKVPIAGVNITDQINLYINPVTFAELSLQQRVEVLEHEVKHVINYHFKRHEVVGREDHELWNIACDAEINEPLKSLHEFGVTQEKLAKAIPNLKLGETAEYYFKQMRDFREKHGKKGQDKLDGAGDTVDDHSMWGKDENGNDAEDSTQNEKLAQQMVKNALKDAVERSGGRSNAPNEVLIALGRLGQSTVNWKQQLKQFYARADVFSKTPTRKRRNRRYGTMYPGKKKKPMTHIAIALDESGSIGNDEFTQFFNENEAILKLNDVRITVIHADCTINRVYEYKQGMKIERTGCGGTAYMPAIDCAKDLKVDGLIYFGDGDIFGEVLTKPKFPVLWAMVGGNKPPAEWGRVCQVEVQCEQR